MSVYMRMGQFGNQFRGNGEMNQLFIPMIIVEVIYLQQTKKQQYNAK